MAEVTGMRNNALPYPVYGVPWAVVFPMLDADGDLVTGATTPDAEVSKNGDTFADCTNESTEIATTSGVYYLLLTGTEMTADIVAVIAKSATAGMKTTVLTFYPRKLVTLRSGTAAGGATGSITLDSGANATDDFYNGCLVVATLDGAVEARIITDYTGSTKVAAVTPNWNTTPDSDDTFIVYLPEGIQVNGANVTHWRGADAAVPTVAGVPEVDVTHWIGTAAATPTVAGVPEVDVTHWIGTAAATPTVAGVPEVDVTHWKGTAAATEDTAGYPKVTIKNGTGAGEIGLDTGAISNVDVVGDATVTAFTAGAITAAAIANAAIDAATFAADARMIAAGKPGSVNDATPAAGNFDGDAGLSATDDFYNGSVLAFTSGSLLGLARKITDYTGSSKNLVFATAFPAAPADTDTFVILGRIE